MKLKVSVIGATGYVGSELIRLLHNHPSVVLDTITSNSYVDQKYNEIFPNFNKLVDDVLETNDIIKISKTSDVIFLALPHGITSKLITSEILHNSVVIDLGADYRIKDLNVYEQWYTTHHSPKLLKESVYGLVELYKEEIIQSRLIANPGCYTTCSIMSLAPLMGTDFVNKGSIIINAASGVSGAGRGAKVTSLYSEVNENYKAYGVASHRHTPEIEQELSILASKDIKLTFTPHLVPMTRGILVTAYIDLIEDVELDKIKQLYKDFYKDAYFVRILDTELPNTKFVKGSNFIDINIIKDERTSRLIVIGAIDNLIKGAAGQAIQNMNIIFGLDEESGLKGVPFIL